MLIYRKHPKTGFKEVCYCDDKKPPKGWKILITLK